MKSSGDSARALVYVLSPPSGYTAEPSGCKRRPHPSRAQNSYSLALFREKFAEPWLKRGALRKRNWETRACPRGDSWGTPRVQRLADVEKRGFLYFRKGWELMK